MPLFELTSSGLSHTQADYYPTAHRNMKNLTPSFYAASEQIFDLNFGNIIIDDSGDVRMEVRNSENKVVLEK